MRVQSSAGELRLPDELSVCKINETLECLTNHEMQNLESNLAHVPIAIYWCNSFDCLVTSFNENFYKEYCKKDSHKTDQVHYAENDLQSTLFHIMNI